MSLLFIRFLQSAVKHTLLTAADEDWLEFHRKIIKSERVRHVHRPKFKYMNKMSVKPLDTMDLLCVCHFE